MSDDLQSIADRLGIDLDGDRDTMPDMTSLREYAREKIRRTSPISDAGRAHLWGDDTKPADTGQLRPSISDDAKRQRDLRAPHTGPGEVYAAAARDARAKVIEQAADAMLAADPDPPVRIIVWRGLGDDITYHARWEPFGADTPVAEHVDAGRATVLIFDADDLEILKAMREDDE